MNRSFVPTELAFDGTVARFELPAEARVMRERGWVCLVRCGDQIAVCRGSLPRVAASRSAPRVALLAGPPAPPVGETLWISGLRVPVQPSAAPIELRVVDTLEEAQSTITLEPAAGTFAAQVPISPDWAGKHLRVLARQDGRTLENVLGRTLVSVAPAEGPGSTCSSRFLPGCRLTRPSSRVACARSTRGARPRPPARPADFPCRATARR